jgi:hypothetical protein
MLTFVFNASTAAALKAGDVVKNDGRAVFTHACQRAGGSREIRFKFDLVGNAQQLLFLLKHG